MQSRTLIVGIDGADPKIIKKMIVQGYMPNLASLMAKSTFSKMDSLLFPLTPPCWATILTGKNPGKHGITNIFNDSNNFVNSTDIKSYTFLEYLSFNDKKINIVNVPLNYPPKIPKSVVVPNFGDPKSAKLHPESDISKFNYSKYDNQILPNDSETSIKEGLEHMLYLIDNNFPTVESILGNDWQASFVLFSETDASLHGACRNLFYEPLSSEALLVKEIYKKIDEKIGIIDSKLNEKDNLVIVSDHGFTSSRHVLHINDILNEWGLISKKFLGFSVLSRSILLNKLTRKLVNFCFPSKVSEKLYKMCISYDFTNSIAYFDEPTRGIFINQTSYSRDKLMHKLSKYSNFFEVHKREKVVTGPYSSKVPSIFLKTKYDDLHLLGVPNGVSLCSKVLLDHHTSNAFFLAKGPTIKKDVEIDSIALTDLAPTILYIMKCDIPNDLDGRVLFELFTNKKKIPKPKYVTPPVFNSNMVNSPKTDEKVMNELRKLGYIK